MKRRSGSTRSLVVGFPVTPGNRIFSSPTRVVPVSWRSTVRTTTQRRALDTSREHLFRESGIAWVDRVTVEAVDNPGELEQTLRRFLRELVKHR